MSGRRLQKLAWALGMAVAFQAALASEVWAGPPFWTLASADPSSGGSSSGSNCYDSGYDSGCSTGFGRWYSVPDPVRLWSDNLAPPSPPPAPPEAVKLPEVAMIDVLVPHDAEVWIQGVKTGQKGLVRCFVTPVIEPDAVFTYRVRVEVSTGRGKQFGERKISVRAGDHAQAAFINLTALSAARSR